MKNEKKTDVIKEKKTAVKKEKKTVVKKEKKPAKITVRKPVKKTGAETVKKTIRKTAIKPVQSEAKKTERRTDKKIEKLKDHIIKILESKKAKDISVVDISELSVLADYFIICSGTSTIHIKSLADEITEKMKKKNFYSIHKEGYSSARWILIDYADIVVHIFHTDERDFYNLDRLWVDGIEIYKEKQKKG